MKELEFYARLCALVDEAHRAGVLLTHIIDDLRILATALDQEEVWK